MKPSAKIGAKAFWLFELVGSTSTGTLLKLPSCQVPGFSWVPPLLEPTNFFFLKNLEGKFQGFRGSDILRPAALVTAFGVAAKGSGRLHCLPLS